MLNIEKKMLHHKEKPAYKRHRISQRILKVALKAPKNIRENIQRKKVISHVMPPVSPFTGLLSPALLFLLVNQY